LLKSSIYEESKKKNNNNNNNNVIQLKKFSRRVFEGDITDANIG
jgi:hypothetical protein